MLMNPEYRKTVDPKYAKKIEAVVRKPPKNGKDSESYGDPIEPLTPCPFCDKMLPETQLLCSTCASNIPFCIVTVSYVMLLLFCLFQFICIKGFLLLGWFEVNIARCYNYEVVSVMYHVCINK